MQDREQAPTRTEQTARHFQEPVLTYNQHTDQWSGTNGQLSVWMDDATFRAYVASWYDWQRWMPGHTSEERYTEAVAHCQQVSYWNGCERNFDHRVHIRYRS